MFRKKDVALIAAVLALAAAVYGVMMITRKDQALSGMVEIRVDGELHSTVALDRPGETRIEQDGGEVNVLSVDGAGNVRMAYSSCRNQLCVQQGSMSADNWARRAMGRTIVCLPNRVLVELSLDEGHPSLLEEDLPDI